MDLTEHCVIRADRLKDAGHVDCWLRPVAWQNGEPIGDTESWSGLRSPRKARMPLVRSRDADLLGEFAA